jgi:uncharacterized protein YndB with AHSA1/START domain
MQKLHFSTHINAPVEKVWNTMLDEDSYREWTKPFQEGSYFKGDWSEGSKMLFLGPSPVEGQGEGGMVSKIKENRLHEFISVEHQGIIVNGVEDTESEEARKWTPANENYTFLEKDSGTELLIEMDVDEKLKDDFETMWPKALEKLKELAEK